MADINDLIKDLGHKDEDIIDLVKSTPNSRLTAAQADREREVNEQKASLFKIKQRTEVPSKKEFQQLIDSYFETIYPENYSKYTLHTYIGFTESNVNSFILTNEDLKEIYEFAIEKMKAKAELTMQIAGRSTDSFAMQNLAGWRKKDKDEQEDVSGLAELHRGIREYKKNTDKKTFN